MFAKEISASSSALVQADRQSVITRPDSGSDISDGTLDMDRRLDRGRAGELYKQRDQMIGHGKGRKMERLGQKLVLPGVVVLRRLPCQRERARVRW